MKKLILFGAMISLFGVSLAAYDHPITFEGCKNLEVVSWKVAKAELEMIKPYFPIAKNEDDFNIVKRFRMRYGNVGIWEDEFQCVVSELKKNLANYDLREAEEAHEKQDTKVEIKKLSNVLWWYPENAEAMYALGLAYEKNGETYSAYKRMESVAKSSKNEKLKELAWEKVRQLEPKAEEVVKETQVKSVEGELEQIKKILWNKTTLVESLAKEIKTKDEATQLNAKAAINQFMNSEDEYTRALGLYLYYLMK